MTEKRRLEFADIAVLNGNGSMRNAPVVLRRVGKRTDIELWL